MVDLNPTPALPSFGSADPKPRPPSFWAKCKGAGELRPAPPPVKAVIVSGVTAFLGILAIALPYHLGASNDVFLILGSFGATAALVYGAPDSPLSQPRNVIGGHMLSAVVGVAIYYLGRGVHCGLWLTAPLSVALAIMVMQVTVTLHPPGAATALIAVNGGAAVHKLGFLYVLAPAGVGAVIMVTVAVLGNNLTFRRYPKYWWG